MANVNKVTNWLAEDTLIWLQATGSLGPAMNTDYNKELKKTYPIGKEFRVKFPFRGLIRNGQQMQIQQQVRRTTDVKMEDPFGIDFSYTDFEEALEMDRSESMLRDEFTMPFGMQLGSELDSRLAFQCYMRIPGIVGSLGTDPTTIATYHLANQRLKEFGVSAGMQWTFMTPSQATALMSTAATNFNPNTDVSDMWRDGNLGMLSGSKTYQSVRLQQHTTGIVTSAAALTVNGAVAEGATSITINCTSGDTFTRGERIAIASVFKVHPETRRRAGTALGNQCVYIVTQAATATSTTVTLQLDRPILGPGGAYQEVDALPVNAALVTRWPGTTIANGTAVTGTVGIRTSRQSVALVGAELKNPKMVEVAQRARDKNTGMAISIVQQYLNQNRDNDTRMDVWTGYGSFYPENCGVCILGV
jgi:hypothetical protein